MGASVAIATGGVLTLFIAAPPKGSSVRVRVADGVSGAVFEQEITADLPADTQFVAPRLHLNTGATAAAVAYDRAGVCVETDSRTSLHRFDTTATSVARYPTNRRQAGLDILEPASL